MVIRSNPRTRSDYDQDISVLSTINQARMAHILSQGYIRPKFYQRKRNSTDPVILINPQHRDQDRDPDKSQKLRLISLPQQLENFVKIRQISGIPSSEIKKRPESYVFWIHIRDLRRIALNFFHFVFVSEFIDPQNSTRIRIAYNFWSYPADRHTFDRSYILVHLVGNTTTNKGLTVNIGS